jgi:hypothetical protein
MATHDVCDGMAARYGHHDPYRLLTYLLTRLLKVTFYLLLLLYKDSLELDHTKAFIRFIRTHRQ